MFEDIDHFPEMKLAELLKVLTFFIRRCSAEEEKNDS